MRTGILRLAALLALGLVLSAAEAQPLYPMSRLSNARLFAFGGVGFAGVTTDGEKAYLSILERRSAETDFEKLLATGTPQAKAYALTGIHKLNPARFKAFADELRTSNLSVRTGHGCVIGTQTLGVIVQGIEKNDR